MKQSDVIRLLRRGRLLAYVVIGALVTYGFLRYDLANLPAEGCSPLHGLEPGSRIVLDRWCGRPLPGAAVFFEGAGGELLLGRVAEPGETLVLGPDALWILSERADCPGRDSRTLGPIPTKKVVGRVAAVLP